MTIFSVNSLALINLTQYTLTPNDYFAWGRDLNNYNIQQQFQVSQNATIKQFSLLIYNDASPVVQTCQLCLYSDSGSDTLGSPIACNDTINVSQVTTDAGGEYFNITIPNSDAIANTKYWINAVNCSADKMRWKGQTTGTYDLGISLVYGNKGGNDLNFIVWGDAYNFNSQINSLEFYPAMSIHANNTLTIVINATDVEVDAINYSIKCSDSDSWGTEDTNATKTCLYETAGIKNFTARVRDVNHLTYNTFSAEINITNTNPQINSVVFIPATTFHVNQTLIARVNATDLEGDTIVYNFKCNVTDVEADSLIANKSCLYKSVGVFNFTAQVRDGFSATYNSLSQNINVTNTNAQINSITFTPATTLELNTTLSASVSATDLDNDTIVYRFKCSNSQNWSNDTSSTFSCLYTNAGTYNFTAQVRDGFSATYNSLSQNIIVTPPRFTPEGRSIYSLFIDVGAGFGIFILLIAQSLPALLIALVLITIIVVIGFAIASIFKSKGRR